MALAVFLYIWAIALGARAEIFKSADFLKWSRDGQEYYLSTSVGMAGLIARQNSASQGDCIDRWYFTDQEKALDRILAVMRQNPTYHPHGVLLAMIEKACGTMTYK